MAAMTRVAVASVLISGATLVMLAGAVLLANLGASQFWFGLLLLVPLTVGLPSTCGVLLVTGLWNGSSLWGYLVLAAVTAWGFQLMCTGAWYSWRRRGQA